MGHILAFHLIVLACLCGSIAMDEVKSKTPPPLDKTSLVNGTALVLNFNHMQPGIHFFVRNMCAYYYFVYSNNESMCNFKDVGNVFFGYDSGYVHFTHSFENYEARLKYLQSATTGTIQIQKTSQTTIHRSNLTATVVMTYYSLKKKIVKLIPKVTTVKGSKK